ncbi:relaxase/mobilization nuclease domain-containing protein [Rhodovulum marinum]|uniref:Relaxase/mobilization nuclease-like protein n=1 Tax=Rhodovulum marinum TaxID=320662 RepID=A0A4R2PQI5_9RHOB|nr:relaxase/mobilization nuclease domain-containing protein [Rhodovulum marinum]TCP38069.1 relaxase/mobilization nuclease-like protein [Rhodovulum marinum]
MIARDTGGGSSFAGAGLYYLHDRNADTDERVAFTHTENLLTDNAETAMKVMAWTAKHQAELKAAAGVKATGRKLEKPVHTFMLSWAPGEQPDHKHMIETARSAVKALGLADHEAVFIGHDDTDKAHVHIIVNRVNPENGKAAPLSKSRLALSRWAEAYEKEHGIHCHRRIENNRRRDQGDRVIDLESRRRNAEQFSDWREKRKAEATHLREKRRFQEWAERKKAGLDQEKQTRKQRLERSQAAQQELIETRLARTYDTSRTQARLEKVEAALAVGGIKGFWHKLTGRKARDAAQRDALQKTIAAARHRHQEALKALTLKLEAQRADFLADERRRAQELEMRIDNARARREREGWKSYKTDRPRGFSVAVEQDNESAERSLRMIHARSGRMSPGPEHER